MRQSCWTGCQRDHFRKNLFRFNDLQGALPKSRLRTHLLSTAALRRRVHLSDSDYLIRVAVADIGALEKFILNQLTPIPGIEKIRSSFALKQVRYKTALPLPETTK